jgi:secreted PhoX family phosphatase
LWWWQRCSPVAPAGGHRHQAELPGRGQEHGRRAERGHRLYGASIIYALGDPLTAATPEFKNDGTDTDYDNRAGDHHDGMEYFGLNAAGTGRDANSSDRGLLAMNHEALTDQFLHAAGVTANPRPVAEADKEIPAHGVSIVEVRKVGRQVRLPTRPPASTAASPR